MDRWVGGGVKVEVDQIAKTEISEEKSEDKTKTNTDLTASESLNI
jgi:hypothetical protein